MPRGGARAGAGRKKGVANQKTRAIAEAAVLTGTTPLEVMLAAMEHFRAAGEIEKAAGIAKDAAPYVHPRLASIEHSGEMKIEKRISSEPMTQEQWESKYAEQTQH
jgi:hypothetical protein